MKNVHVLTLAIIVIVALSEVANTQTYTDLYDFDGVHGASPIWPQVIAQGEDGKLYSTTYEGGLSNSGVIFAVSPAGELSVLYTFKGTEGDAPSSGLTLAPSGSFYGTASFGGHNNRGIIFKVTPSGNGAILYNFSGGHDGGEPYSPPVEGADGHFYGATAFGGFPAVYKMTRSGEFTLIGAPPGPSTAPMLQGTDGSFYGTTVSGGNPACSPPSGCGTIFRLTRDGVLRTVHAFDGIDGAYLNGSVIEGADGNLYGTAVQGGSNLGGVVFSLTPQGSLTVLHNFPDPNYPNDGNSPVAGLVQATDGNLYGVTNGGGELNGGLIFRISADGTYSILYDFDGTHGYAPASTPMQHTNGKIYGMTNQGGTSNLGVLYSVDLGLPQFVSLMRPAGLVGQTGGILGQGFTGTTSVTLNGIPASFTVKSDTYLVATVPPGATTGYVTVTTPTGVLTSNKKFVVLP